MVWLITFIILVLPINILVWTKIIGRKKIVKNRKMILACNHMSWLDCIMLAIKRRKRFKFLMKQEVATNRLLSWYLNKLGAIPVNREKLAPSTVKEIYKVLKSDNPLVIFPQGTRKKIANIESEDMKNGVALFAIKTNSPIVPVAINKKMGLFRFSKIIIGDDILTDDFTTSKEDVEKLSIIIADKINNLIIEDSNKKNKKLDINPISKKTKEKSDEI